MAFIPNIPSSPGTISEFDKAMMVAKHKGASVAGGLAVGRDRRMVSRLASVPSKRRCRGGEVNAAPQKLARANSALRNLRTG